MGRFNATTLAAAVCACTLGLLAGHASGVLTQDFDIGDTSFTPDQRNAAGPGPIFIPDGNGSNGAMRLTSEVGSSQNTIAFDWVGGAVTIGTFEFDFRMSDRADDDGADGIGVLFLNTLDHGTTGAGPNFGEEANAANSLGIGIDNHDNGEGAASVSLHLGGTTLGSTDVSGAIDLESGSWHHMRVILNQNDAGAPQVGRVFIELTDGDDGDVLTDDIDLAPIGFIPYETRIAFGSRTGGLNSNHDIDNVVASFTGGTTTATFDYGMHSNQGTGSISQGPEPGPQIVNIGGAHGNVLRLTTDGFNNQRNRVVFDTVQEWKDGFRASFDLRMGDGDFGGADGASFILLNTANFGTTGPLTQDFVEEEPNLAGSFGVGFDTFNNGAAQDANAEQSVSLHFDGNLVGLVGLPNDPNILESGEFNTAIITLTEVAGGAQVDLSLITPGGEIQLFDDHFIADLFPYEARIAFAGRTGGAFHHTDLDNILVDFGTVPEPGTAMLALLGLGGLGLRRRRRAV